MKGRNMPQCKKDMCKEQAVPYGKRYCPKHLAEYHAKQKKYEAIRATLPTCGQCSNKLTLAAANRGDTLCRECGQAEEEQRLRNMKYYAFESAKTVEDLKNWMREYIYDK